MAKINFLLDTGIISRFVFGEKSIVSDVKKMGIENISISIVSLIELNNWLVNLPSTKAEKLFFKKQIHNLPVIHIDKNISVLAEKISLINPNSKAADLLIYCTSKIKKLEIKTLNTKDFKLKRK